MPQVQGLVLNLTATMFLKGSLITLQAHTLVNFTQVVFVLSFRIFLPVLERQGKLELKSLLKQLVSLGVHHLLVEGGGEIAWSLIRERLVDRLIWIVAPKIVGGREAKTSVEGEGVEKLRKAIPLEWEKVYRVGPDWIFEAKCSQES